MNHRIFPLVALAVPVFIASCERGGGGGEVSPPGPAGARDSGVRDSTPPGLSDVSAPVLDAGCQQDLVTDKTCVHPAVVAECAAGWCRIPRGCFVAGSPLCEQGRARDSEPQVQVTLTHDFEIQRHEASQGEWTALGFVNHSLDPGYAVTSCGAPECPVTNMTVVEAAQFANKLSESKGLPACYRIEGCEADDAGITTRCATWAQNTPSLYDCKGYRLPTELEWEYAARAGTKTMLYSGEVEHWAASCDLRANADKIAWYCGNSNPPTVHPPGQKTPNGWGLYDMSGNAAEWVTSVYNSWGYGKGPLVDPFSTLDPAAELQVSRGGGAYGFLSVIRSAKRDAIPPPVHGVGYGFRLVRTLPNR